MRFTLSTLLSFFALSFLSLKCQSTVQETHKATLPTIQLKNVVSGLRDPVQVVAAPGESGRLYILEQTGKIVVYENGRVDRESPFLNLEKKVSYGGEAGLLGLVFHPKYAENRRYFVNYTAKRPNFCNIIAEYRVGSSEEKVLLKIDKPYRNHNAGQLAFGPDGYLYIGTGDGGSGGDPHGNGQNLKAWLGKMLRIDVDRTEPPLPYAIPPDNPFMGGNALKEIFAYGIRNPWRFSFDRQTGDLWVGDVGQNLLEEIDIVEKGQNYGWKVMEANICFNPPQGCSTKGLTLPIHQYGRTEGISVTGGFVYRGKALPEFNGIYIYGDYGSGKIWGLQINPDTKRTVSNTLLLESELPISSFGEDLEGEIYVVSHRGAVLKIVK